MANNGIDMNALRLKPLARTLRTLGPYLLIELLLPGGTVIALSLWWFRRAGASVPAPQASADAQAADFQST
jgi:hypothetical protein